MVSKEAILNELAIRIGLAKERGDHQAVENYATTWHRINQEDDRAFSISGLSRRIAAREALKPLAERIHDGEDRPRVGDWA